MPKGLEQILMLGMNIPIWGIILFFFSRMIKKRDAAEEEFKEDFKELSKLCTDLETKFAVAQAGHNNCPSKSLMQTITNINEDVITNKKDLNECFKNVRENKTEFLKVNETVFIQRKRAHYFANQFQRLQLFISKKFPEDSFEFDSMPED